MQCNGSTVAEITDVINGACSAVKNMADFNECNVRVIAFSEQRQVHLSCTEDDFVEIFGTDAIKSRSSAGMERLSAAFGGCEFFILVEPQVAEPVERIASAATQGIAS